ASVNMQEKGHWNLSTSNAWGSLAVEKFQKKFEAEKVSGETVMKSGAESFIWKANSKQGAEENIHTFSWKTDKSKTITMQHKGEGQPWVSIQNRAARSLKKKEEFGFQVEKSVKNLTRPDATTFKKGDLIRVRIEVSS